jgi:hypothetical protein
VLFQTWDVVIVIEKHFLGDSRDNTQPPAGVTCRLTIERSALLRAQIQADATRTV